MPSAFGGGLITSADQLADNVVTSAKILDLEIVNADIAAAAAIVDTKLAQLITAAKVSGAALTLLPSIPAGAGEIPAANVPAGAQDLEQLADVNLGTANAQLLSGTISARAFLKVVIICPDTSAAADIQLQFNSDAGANYAYATSLEGGTDASETTQSEIDLGASSGQGFALFFDMVNRQANQKIGAYQMSELRATLSPGGRFEGKFVWHNTAAQITVIRLFMSSGTLAAGTRMIIYGSSS